MAQRLEQDLDVQAASTPRYDWDSWLDGAQWVLVQGDDFYVNPWVFRMHARNVARRRGVQLRTKVGSDRVWIQSDRPAPTRPPSTRGRPGEYGATTRQVLSLIAEVHPSTMGRAEISTWLPDIPRGTLDSILSRCVRRGLLERPAPHVYRLIDPTPEQEPTTP